MTPPRPTAPTAAELRERFVDEWDTREHWDSGGVRMGADLDAIMEAARAEAVAPVMDVLRQLVAACHKCANCESPAMRKAANEALYCDAHGYYLSGTQMDDHRIAAPLRAALALLAADQAGEKAGKP